MEYVTLYNGIKMPILGYGVFQIRQDIEVSIPRKAILMRKRLEMP